MAQTLENYKAKLDKMLHEKNAITDILEKIEQKTGVRRLYIAYGEQSATFSREELTQARQVKVWP